VEHISSAQTHTQQFMFQVTSISSNFLPNSLCIKHFPLKQ